MSQLTSYYFVGRYDKCPKNGVEIHESERMQVWSKKFEYKVPDFCVESYLRCDGLHLGSLLIPGFYVAGEISVQFVITGKYTHLNKEQ